jgi:hypothetical protein
MIGGLRAIFVMSVLAVVLPSVPHEPASLVHQVARLLSLCPNVLFENKLSFTTFESNHCRLF